MYMYFIFDLCSTFIKKVFHMLFGVIGNVKNNIRMLVNRLARNTKQASNVFIPGNILTIDLLRTRHTAHGAS